MLRPPASVFQLPAKALLSGHLPAQHAHSWPTGRGAGAPWQDNTMQRPHGDTTDSAPSKKDQSESASPASRSHGHVSALKYTGAAIVGVAIFAGAIVAMGGRFEDADLTPETPSAEETARQDLAVQAHQITTASQALLDSSPDSTRLATLHETASQYEDQLGGVWVPWPSGAPSGYTNPPLATDSPADLKGEDLVSEIKDFSGASLKAADAASDEDAPMYLSMALGSRLLGEDYAESIGSDDPVCGEVNIELAAQVLAPSGSLDVIDASRQWLETDTARMDPESRDSQIARGDALDSFIEAMITNDATDNREAFSAYPDLAGDETYSDVALGNISSVLISNGVDASPEQREALLSFGCSLYLTPSERSAALPFPGN